MWRHHRTRNSLGRTRQRLARRLSEHFGCTVEAEDLDASQGFYRQQRSGHCCWSGSVFMDGITWSITSFDTMTECLRNGFTVEDTRAPSKRGYADFEVHAKERKS